MKLMRCVLMIVVLFGLPFRLYPDVPKEGYVPNAQTAVRIAEAILIPMYGEERVAAERPYVAELKKDGYWFVRGTKKQDDLSKNPPIITKGGGMVVVINKTDGKIMSVFEAR
jgi:hypothetical protein